MRKQHVDRLSVTKIRILKDKKYRYLRVASEDKTRENNLRWFVHI